MTIPASHKRIWNKDGNSEVGGLSLRPLHIHDANGEKKNVSECSGTHRKTQIDSISPGYLPQSFRPLISRFSSNRNIIFVCTFLCYFGALNCVVFLLVDRCNWTNKCIISVQQTPLGTNRFHSSISVSLDRPWNGFQSCVAILAGSPRFRVTSADFC